MLLEGEFVLKLARRRTIVTNYPFLQFLSVVAIPTAFWVAYVEIGVLDQWDVDFILTFGQVGSVHIFPLA